MEQSNLQKWMANGVAGMMLATGVAVAETQTQNEISEKGRMPSISSIAGTKSPKRKHRRARISKSGPKTPKGSKASPHGKSKRKGNADDSESVPFA